MVFAVVASVALNRVIARTYPYLETDMDRGKELAKKYPDILTKVKQLFFHKIGGFALSQTSPIIIYAYTTLTVVALYGNYMLIIMGGQTLMTAIFNSMNAGIGNLVAEGNRERILAVFEELFSIRFLFTCVMCFGVFILTPSFIILWIGNEYVLDSMVLLLMTMILFINLSRTTVDTYINAYGLYGDIWAPVVEASINIGMSVVLGYFFGLHGVLSGVLLSLFFVVFCWKPYFLFRKGFKLRLYFYVRVYVKHLISAVICAITVYSISMYIPFVPWEGWTCFVFYGIFIIILFCIFQIVLSCYIGNGMRSFLLRLLQFYRSKYL